MFCFLTKTDLHCRIHPLLIALGIPLPLLNVNLSFSRRHVIAWPEAPVEPCSAWLLGTLLAWPWLLHTVFFPAMSLSRHALNLQPLLECIARPCQGPFSYTALLTYCGKKRERGGSRCITDGAGFICSRAVKKRWFVALTLAALGPKKQDGARPDDEHPPAEHKQQVFIVLRFCEHENRCYVNHPPEACKHGSSARSQKHLWTYWHISATG